MPCINLCSPLRLPFRVRLCDLLFLILIALLAMSCGQPIYVRSAAACPLPPPPPECRPTTFGITTYDTTSTTARGASYWAIDNVVGADTEFEEFGLLMPRKHITLLVSGSDAGSAGYRGMTLRAVDTVAQRSLDASRGSDVSFISTQIRAGSIMGDASLMQSMANEDGIHGSLALDAPWNLPVYWDGHATTSPNGEWMVFSSDRPGTLGGTDLWCVRMRNGAFGQPRWCGSVINTPCDELSPQFTPDGTALLFSSAGHSTVGGYDLFRVNFRVADDSLVFTTVENLGKPINTTFDEVFPVQADSTTLYYGSNQQREGAPHRRDFDVYVLHRIHNGQPPTTKLPLAETPEPPVIPPPLPVLPAERATITGVVINEQTQQPVPDAEVTAREPGTKAVISSTRTDSAGRYTLDVPVDVPVDVSASSSDLFYDAYQVKIPKEQQNDTIVREAPLSLPITYMLRVNFPTSMFDTPYENTLDSNGLETTQSWSSALDELALNVKGSMGRLKRLVLIGHTDDVDSDASNMKLGKQRVEFIMKKLTERGIPQDLMEGRSAGERLKPNRRPGESLDLWRKRCRRVELVKVLQ